MSSTFEVPVIKIKLLPHPNADTLSIIKYRGYQTVVKTEEFKNDQLCAFIPPDSVVPNRPEWEFLGSEPRHRRIRARKYRGEWSHGILQPAPEGYGAGHNVSEVLGITAYEPISAAREGMPSRNRRRLPWYRRILSFWKEMGERPRGRFPYYDIENFRKFPDLFQPDDSVIITEKIHGANALYTSKRPWYQFWSNELQIYMRSRTMWKNPFKRDWWQDAYRNTPGIEKLLRKFPGMAIYGEVYGRGIQELEYGAPGPQFVAFDLWNENAWVAQDVAIWHFDYYNIPHVPVLYIGKFIDYNNISSICNENKKSIVAKLHGSNQMSEGIVVQGIGNRKILKLISDEYLMKAK
jgi:hypothetical protein